MMWSFYTLVALGCAVFGGTVIEFFFVPRPFYYSAALLGVALLIVAGVIRMAAIRTLGKFWSLHIEIRTEHVFVRQGLYRYVRHPAYLSFLLEIIAIPLIGNAWWSLGAALVGYVPLLLLRLRQEEAALVARFGDTYRAYQQEVGALIPRFPIHRMKRVVD
jgi:protein-S-isoprenylcysteine O-methyltransferase Ste14